MLLLVNLIRGALIGVAEVIPGVSGGTVALIVGLYRKLIDAIADVVLAGRRLITGPRSDVGPLIRGLPWAMLIPVAVGMVTAVILGARIIEPLLETHPEQVRALFFGLGAAGIVVPRGMLLRTPPGGFTWRDAVLIVVAAAAAALLTGLPPGNVTDPPLVRIRVGEPFVLRGKQPDPATKRIMKASIRPPQRPLIMPQRLPMTSESRAPTRPTPSETRAPASSR